MAAEIDRSISDHKACQGKIYEIRGLLNRFGSFNKFQPSIIVIHSLKKEIIARPISNTYEEKGKFEDEF